MEVPASNVMSDHFGQAVTELSRLTKEAPALRMKYPTSGQIHWSELLHICIYTLYKCRNQTEVVWSCSSNKEEGLFITDYQNHMGKKCQTIVGDRALADLKPFN